MLFVFGIALCLAVNPVTGVMPSVPSISNPSEEQGNRHARRRDAKRLRNA
jgi:hypothetical protein